MYRLICLILGFFVILKVVQDFDHAMLYLWGFLTLGALLFKLDAFDLNLIFPTNRTVYTYLSLFILFFSRHFVDSMNLAIFPLALSLVLKRSWFRGIFFGAAAAIDWFYSAVFALFFLLKRMWCLLLAALIVPLILYFTKPEWMNLSLPLIDIPPTLSVMTFLIFIIPVIVFELWKRHFSYPLLYLIACYTTMIFPKTLVLPLLFLLPLTWLFIEQRLWGYLFICCPLLLYWVVPSSNGENDWRMLQLMTASSLIFYWTTLSASFPKVHGKRAKGSMIISIGN